MDRFEVTQEKMSFVIETLEAALKQLVQLRDTMSRKIKSVTLLKAPNIGDAIEDITVFASQMQKKVSAAAIENVLQIETAKTKRLKRNANPPAKKPGKKKPEDK